MLLCCRKCAGLWRIIFLNGAKALCATDGLWCAVRLCCTGRIIPDELSGWGSAAASPGLSDAVSVAVLPCLPDSSYFLFCLKMENPFIRELSCLVQSPDKGILSVLSVGGCRFLRHRAGRFCCFGVSGRFSGFSCRRVSFCVWGQLLRRFYRKRGNRYCFLAFLMISSASRQFPVMEFQSACPMVCAGKSLEPIPTQ